jgi:hypothetical protein
MPAQVFANNAQTTLASICNPGDISISVVSAAGFPTSVPYTVLIDQEFMLVTSGAATTTWGVSRAQEGTSAGTHSATAAVVQDWTVGGLNSLEQSYYTYWGVQGLTGAIQPSRYVGATGTGTPGSGTFQVGDFIVIQTGGLAVCTVAGTPGTWASMLPQSNNITGHLVFFAAGAPTTSALNPNLVSATLGANSTDVKGTITFTVSGTPIGAGAALCTLNFNSAYSNANYSVQLTISSTGVNTGWVPAVTAKATGSFEIWNASATTITASSVFTLDYTVLG